MDPGTGLTILGTAVGSAKLVEKILGPTADYIGDGLAEWTKKRVDNVSRIFTKAHDKLGDRIDQPGMIPPLILKGIFEDGSYRDDEVVAEYFGGVLASSRTGVSRDDRGGAYLNTITRLSTYQIRAHFFLYSIFRNLYRGHKENLARLSSLRNLGVFIPDHVIDKAMAFIESEDRWIILTHCTNGLVREELISPNRFFGKAENVGEFMRRTVPCSGLYFEPSILGIELYLWAHGQGDIPVKKFLEVEIDLKELNEVEIIEGSERKVN